MIDKRVSEWIDIPEFYIKYAETICELYAYSNGYKEGAAVAFGLIGMAEVIRNMPGIKACPVCLKYKGSSVMGMDNNTFLKRGEWMCIQCYDLKKSEAEESIERSWFRDWFK